MTFILLSSHAIHWSTKCSLAPKCATFDNILSIRYPLIHQEDQDEDTAEACFLEFHASHGKNIELSNLNLTASRTASYNQGIVLSHKPLIRNHVLKVCMSLTWTMF